MKKKYMRILVSLPDSTYQTLAKSIPFGKRSTYIGKLIEQNLSPKEDENMETFWAKIDSISKGDYSHEDPVKISKEAWNYVD